MALFIVGIGSDELPQGKDKAKGEQVVEKVLQLPMKKKWYDMVLSGEKRQEYRLVKPYWETRIRNWIIANIPDRASDTPIILCEDKERDTERRLPICFINGYGKDAPRFIGYCYSVEIRRIGLQKKWGEGDYDGIPHFVLHLGHIAKELTKNGK